MQSKSSAGSEELESQGLKKPLIAKWKAGAKLQVTSRAQNDGKFESLSFLPDLTFNFPQQIPSLKVSSEHNAPASKTSVELR